VIKEHLIVFTRYPEPGKAKTRLIPVLGAAGAANLHRQMTEYTIGQVRELQANRKVYVEVYFTGSESTTIQNWLGQDLVYQSQGEGDLGMRMLQAFAVALKAEANAIAIGTDCPSLNSQLLAQAFEMLPHHDLVLGPATDGGYYLIGLRRLIPELFAKIHWGTSEVFPQTVKIAANLNLSVAYLPTLSDIDRPEDLDNFRF
jgi:uncharacterized protein